MLARDNSALSTVGTHIMGMHSQCVKTRTYILHSKAVQSHISASPGCCLQSFLVLHQLRHTTRMIVAVTVIALATLLPAPAMAKEDPSIYRSKSKTEVLSSNFARWLWCHCCSMRTTSAADFDTTADYNSSSKKHDCSASCCDCTPCGCACTYALASDCLHAIEFPGKHVT
jgi:hypothetical protein